MIKLARAPPDPPLVKIAAGLWVFIGSAAYEKAPIELKIPVDPPNFCSPEPVSYNNAGGLNSGLTFSGSVNVLTAISRITNGAQIKIFLMP